MLTISCFYNVMCVEFTVIAEVEIVDIVDEVWQNMLPWNISLWYTDYFAMKSSEKQQIQGEAFCELPSSAKDTPSKRNSVATDPLPGSFIYLRKLTLLTRRGGKKSISHSAKLSPILLKAHLFSWKAFILFKTHTSPLLLYY